MPNPYEPRQYSEHSLSTPWRTANALVAGLLGYVAPFLILGVMAWLTYGGQVASDNLARVLRLHLTPSLNSVSAFLPNMALSLLCAFTIASWDQNRVRRRILVVLCSTLLLSYTLVLYIDNRWLLIPWTWSPLASNLTRTVLISLLPLTVLLAALLAKTRFGRLSSLENRS